MSVARKMSIRDLGQDVEGVVERIRTEGELLLTSGGRVVARLVPVSEEEGSLAEAEEGRPARRRFGMGRGLGHVPPDFSDTPEDFKDYL